GGFLFGLGERGHRARQRSGILWPAVSRLRVSLQRRWLGGFFEKQQREIPGFFRERFQFLCGQRMTKHGERRDLAGKVFTLGPGQRERRHFQNAAHGAQIQLAVGYWSAFSGEVEVASVEGSRDEMPLSWN